MIDLGTLAGLHERRHELAAYCPRCDRWPELDLAAMVTASHRSSRLPVPVTCSACGSPGELQVRQPVPTRAAG